MYLDLVMGLNFCVDWLLLLGTDRLAGYRVQPGRAAVAAGIGGVYGGICLLPDFRFLGSLFWRVVFLVLMALTAFGIRQSAVRRCAIFVILSMALGGIALGIGRGAGTLLLCAAGLSGLCLLAFRRGGVKQYAIVHLRKGDQQRTLTVLLDTGNSLTDPVTGKPVLVVGGQIAREMLGLTQAELNDPIQTMLHCRIPTLRMIPYRSVGCSSGMLLGVTMDEIIMDGKATDMLVAFAPQIMAEGEYEGLAGGFV